MPDQGELENQFKEIALDNLENNDLMDKTSSKECVKERLHQLTAKLAACISIQDNERLNEIMGLGKVINTDALNNLYNTTLNELNELMDYVLENNN